jgi:hypothetical protein
MTVDTEADSSTRYYSNPRTGERSTDRSEWFTTVKPKLVRGAYHKRQNAEVNKYVVHTLISINVVSIMKLEYLNNNTCIKYNFIHLRFSNIVTPTPPQVLRKLNTCNCVYCCIYFWKIFILESCS